MRRRCLLAAPRPLTLINVFEVPSDEADRFIAAWEKTRDHLATQPGYVDTALHQAVSPGTDFQFVNIARWRTAEEFMAATQSPGFRSPLPVLSGTGPIRACTAWSAPDRQVSALGPPRAPRYLADRTGGWRTLIMIRHGLPGQRPGISSSGRKPMCA
jgi:heme-degrading monooxygenase HmoA